MRTTMMTSMMMMILRGWRPASTGFCRPLRMPTFPCRAWWLPRDRKAGNMRVAGGRRRLAARVPTRPLPLPGVGPTCCHDLPKRPVQAIRSRPLERGRAAAVAPSQGGGRQRSVSPEDRPEGRAKPRHAPVLEQPRASTHGGSRPVDRGTGRRTILPVG